jgi:hypothetical protein
MDAPPDPTNAYTANARARRRGSGNSVTIMPRITDAVIAAPTPCANRAAISSSGPPASPDTSDEAVKTTSPARNIRRRPTRSPSRPASSSSPPKAIRYAFTTQASPDCEKPRSCWMERSATFTIVSLRMIIKDPADSTASAAVRRETRPDIADLP